MVLDEMGAGGRAEEIAETVFEELGKLLPWNMRE